jgi:hypothetical protein
MSTTEKPEANEWGEVIKPIDELITSKQPVATPKEAEETEEE